jgi:hypothetical protein
MVMMSRVAGSASFGWDSTEVCLIEGAVVVDFRPASVFADARS